VTRLRSKRPVFDPLQGQKLFYSSPPPDWRGGPLSLLSSRYRGPPGCEADYLRST